MAKPTILLQLDTDARPSVFDSIVAIDAGVDYLLPFGNVQPDMVRSLVYGTIFTRGVDDLKHTAIFVGGSDVTAGETLLREIQQTFFGPLRVSLMLDSNGANTTAAAAVLAASRQIPLAGTRVLVLASTGPVGSRLVNLLASCGSIVRVASRSRERADALCRAVALRIPHAKLESAATESSSISTVLDGVQVIISAGARASRCYRNRPDWRARP